MPRHVSYPMPSWWHDVDGPQAGEHFGVRDPRIYLDGDFGGGIQTKRLLDDSVEIRNLIGGQIGRTASAPVDLPQAAVRADGLTECPNLSCQGVDVGLYTRVGVGRLARKDHFVTSAVLAQLLAKRDVQIQ